MGLLLGNFSQRAIEYPWLLKLLKKFVPRDARVLDVGCAESLLSHKLVSIGYQVWGVDINDYYLKPSNSIFIKKDIRDTGLPNNFFDAVICVPTIEHIGLPVYGQKAVDPEGDVKAIWELWRILKPGGYLFLTTPFAGRAFRIVPGTIPERQYDLNRLMNLAKNFNVVIMDIYIPIRKDRRIMWVKVPSDIAKRIITSPTNPGLACLMLEKQRMKVS